MSEITLNRLEAYVVAEAGRTDAPKYICVFEAFTKGIRQGEFKPGDRVPTETELSRRLPVSLGTLQKALSKLTDRGLLVRNRKSGTYIADRRSQPSEVNIYRFKDTETGKVILPFTRVLDRALDVSPGPWRKGVSAKRFVRIDRLVWVDQDPPSFNSLYVAHKYGKPLLEEPLEELHGSSYHRFMFERFNLPTLRMEHKIGCRALSASACKNLMVEEGTFGTVWDIQNFTFDDEPYLFQRFELPPGHRPIEIAEMPGG